MITVAPSTSYETVQALGATGLVGTAAVRVINNTGTTTTARSTASVTEYPAGSGIYQKTLTSPSAPGQYTVIWDNGASTPGNVFTQELVVSAASAAASAVGLNYISTAQLKATLDLGSTSYADDDITAAITAASRGIDAACDRRFYPDADALQVRYYTPASARTTWVDDLITVTSVAIDSSFDRTYSTAWTENSDYTLEPLNADTDGHPFTRLSTLPMSASYFRVYPRSVKVTGKFGWSAVPGPVVEATTILAAKLLKRARDAPFGLVSYGIEAPTARRILGDDPDVSFLISPYRKLSV